MSVLENSPWHWERGWGLISLKLIPLRHLLSNQSPAADEWSLFRRELFITIFIQELQSMP